MTPKYSTDIPPQIPLSLSDKSSIFSTNYLQLPPSYMHALLPLPYLFLFTYLRFFPVSLILLRLHSSSTTFSPLLSIFHPFVLSPPPFSPFLFDLLNSPSSIPSPPPFSIPPYLHLLHSSLHVLPPTPFSTPSFLHFRFPPIHSFTYFIIHSSFFHFPHHPNLRFSTSLTPYPFSSFHHFHYSLLNPSTSSIFHSFIRPPPPSSTLPFLLLLSLLFLSSTHA